MIRQITEEEIRREFLPLMAEVEAGSWFDLANPVHTEWLLGRISRRIGCGGQFYAFYSSAGFVTVAELPGLNGPVDRGQVCMMKKLG